jgi:hypothetical protein
VGVGVQSCTSFRAANARNLIVSENIPYDSIAGLGLMIAFSSTARADRSWATEPSRWRARRPDTPGTTLLAATELGADGVVVADSDLFGDDCLERHDHET